MSWMDIIIFIFHCAYVNIFSISTLCRHVFGWCIIIFICVYMHTQTIYMMHTMYHISHSADHMTRRWICYVHVCICVHYMFIFLLHAIYISKHWQSGSEPLACGQQAPDTPPPLHHVISSALWGAPLRCVPSEVKWGPPALFPHGIETELRLGIGPSPPPASAINADLFRGPSHPKVLPCGVWDLCTHTHTHTHMRILKRSCICTSKVSSPSSPWGWSSSEADNFFHCVAGEGLGIPCCPCQKRPKKPRPFWMIGHCTIQVFKFFMLVASLCDLIDWFSSWTFAGAFFSGDFWPNLSISINFTS